MSEPKVNEKDLALRIIQDQPDDCTLEELARELLFHQMIQESLADSQAGRFVTHEQVKKEAESWFKSSGRQRGKGGSKKRTTLSPKTTQRRRSA